MSYVVRWGRLEIEETMPRRNIGKPHEPNRRILAKEVSRPDHHGLWSLHATKGWRRVRKP